MKRLIISVFAVALTLASLGVNPVQAGTAECGATYTVQRGDYLNSIARKCGTTARALLEANSWIFNWNLIYPGQVLTMPNGQIPPTGGTLYTVQAGDTMRKIAAKFDVTLAALIKANPNILNPNIIYVGQKVNIPGGVPAQTYTVKRGDYLRSIAARFSTSVAAILNANAFITNPGVIYVGQVLTIPAGGGQPVVAITPRSGKAESKIYVVAGSFPANQDVAIDLGQQGQTLSQVLTSRTDSSGYVNRLVTIPSSAEAGEKWVARVRTTGLSSNVSARSIAFTVK